jgi:anti-sigma regulatory factor (Ser/Thr protein kinase)
VASDENQQEPDVRYEFGHDQQAPARARREIDELLPDPDDVIRDDVRLTTSELVTNVIRHTTDGGEMRAWDPRPDVPLRLEVEDPEPGTPAIPSNRPDIGGRGLAIVDQVSDDWGVDEQPSGKTVWAEFDRNQRKPGSEDQD